MRKKLFAAFAAALFLFPFAFSVENCVDLFRFDYASGALIPIYGQDVSPGGSVLAIRSIKPAAFYLGENGYAEYFYIALQDQYDGGKQIMAVGDVFYRHQNATGFNNTYFRKAKQTPVYVESGDEVGFEFQAGFAFEYRGRSDSVAVMRVFTLHPVAFGVGASVGRSVVVLAESLDSASAELSKGAVFLESSDGLVFVPDGRVRFIGSCTASCADVDSVDYYYNSTCKSTLSDGTDYCLSASELVEFTCSPQNNCVPQAFSCPFGCVDGKCVSGEKAKCDDSDGLNVAQRGRTSGNYANGSKFSFVDSCPGATKVLEYSCTNAKVLKSEVVDCKGGSCENGACVPLPVVAECSDSDGGRDYEKAGVCADSTGSYADACSPGSLVEYYCDAGYCKTIVSPCSECANNACSKAALMPQSNIALFALVVIVALALVLFWMRGRK